MGGNKSRSLLGRVSRLDGRRNMVNGIILACGHCLDLTPFDITPVGVVKVPSISLGEAAINRLSGAGIREITILADCGAHLWAQSISEMDDNMAISIVCPTSNRGALGAINESMLTNGFDPDGCLVYPDNVISALNLRNLIKIWEQKQEDGIGCLCLTVVVPSTKDYKPRNGYTIAPPDGYSYTEIAIVSKVAVEMTMATVGHDKVEMLDIYQACADRGSLETIQYNDSFFVVENQTHLRMLLK